MIDVFSLAFFSEPDFVLRHPEQARTDFIWKKMHHEQRSFTSEQNPPNLHKMKRHATFDVSLFG